MLGINRQAARITWTVFLVCLALLTIYAVRDTLIVFMLALFFAYMLTPVVDFVQGRVPQRISRNVSLALVYVLLLAVLVTLGILLGTKIADEGSNLAAKLPQLVNNRDWIEKIPLPGWLTPIRERMNAYLRGEFQSGGKDLMPYLEKAGKELLAHASNILFIILIPILAFFFLKDGQLMRESVVDAVAGGDDRKLFEEILDDVHTLLAQYIRALLTLSVATFLAYTIFLKLIGMSYFVLLAGIAAVLEFIPVVGPLSAGIIIMVVAAGTGFPHVLWILLFWAIYRVFQDYVISPYLMSAGVELHPLLVLFGVLAGEQVGGIPGMFFSVPVIATLRVIYVRAARERQRQRLSVTPSPITIESA